MGTGFRVGGGFGRSPLPASRGGGSWPAGASRSCRASTTAVVCVAERRVPAAERTMGVGRTELLAYPHTSAAVSTTSRSFATSSSSVSALPSTVEEKPHCGDRQSWSRST